MTGATVLTLFVLAECECVRIEKERILDTFSTEKNFSFVFMVMGFSVQDYAFLMPA